jgi:hypothetical protein
MAKRIRDYKAEYRRRMARGRLKGLSTAQARGHRLATERAVSERPSKPLSDEKLQFALQELRKQGSLTKAARSLRISRERLSRIAQEQGAIERTGSRWRVKHELTRKFPIYSENKLVTILGGFHEASKAGTFMSAVGRFLQTNRLSEITPFEGQGVTDRNGQFFPFETDPNHLYRLAAARDRSFENIYRIII